MGKEVNLMDRYPKSSRPIAERGLNTTENHIKLAAKFDKEYFDGSRMTGYGGYYYHPRFWTETVKRFRDYYQLSDNARILDIGCAKGFMIYDFSLLMPKAELVGIDISDYAIENAKPEIAHCLSKGSADNLKFEDNSFDLVISINTIHNLGDYACQKALSEIQRVSRHNSFVMVDAWRNEQEKKSMMDWNLQAKTIHHVNDWLTVFDSAGYKGDYWWFIAETTE